MTVADAITELVEFINRVEHGIDAEDLEDRGIDATANPDLTVAPTEGEVAAMWRLIGLGKAVMAWTAMIEDAEESLTRANLSLADYGHGPGAPR